MSRPKVLVRNGVEDCIFPPGPIGATGPPGTGGPQKTSTFQWGVPFPWPLFTAGAGQTVLTVWLVVTEPFNGVGATISIGDAGDPVRLMDVSQNNPGEIGVYQTTPIVLYRADTPLILTMVRGSGGRMGQAQVFMQFV